MNCHLNIMLRMLLELGFFPLQNIANLRHFLSQDNAEKLIHAFVMSQLDYCNKLFSGLPNP